MKLKLFYFPIIVCLILLTTTDILHAQFKVNGTVTDSKSGEPLVGVSIVVKNTTIGVTTDTKGNYDITVPGSQATLTFSYVGYISKEFQVSTQTGTLNVQLKEDVLGLQEVVVTGLATSIKRQNAANSVATVSAKELGGTTVNETIDGALYGKISGAQISANSGAPGGGFTVKLRGVTTINGASQPLYVVDGVIVDNSSNSAGLNAVTAAAAGGSSSNQDNPTNRIADLNPEDIQSIDVLKGASAAAIYGARASNGVVIIKTKRGRIGAPKISFSQSIGFNSISKRLGVRQFTLETALANYAPPPGAGATPDEIAAYQARKSFVESLYNNAEQNGFINYENEMYGQKGLLSNSGLSVSWGTAKTQFFVSGLLKNEDGIIKHTGYEKQSLRANIDHQVSKSIHLSVTSNYIHSTSDRGLTNNDNTGVTFGVSLAATPNFVDLRPNQNGIYPDHPFNTANPLQTRDLMTNRETIDRFIASGKVDINLLQTNSHIVKVIAEGGVDNYTQQNKSVFPRRLQFERISAQPGTSIFNDVTNMNTNLRGVVLHTYNPPSGQFTLVSQAGLSINNADQNTIVSVANNLIGVQTNLDQSASINTQQNRTFQNDRGIFLQEEFNVKDTYILTAGVRGDKSSRNGNVDKFYFYPKASLAVNLSNMKFWNVKDINQFKLRIAFGQSGNFANFGAKYTTLGPSNIGGYGGILIGTTRGTEGIRPEQQTEIETGFDASFFDDRATLEFTLYQKRITDMLLNRELEPSTGYQFETFNGGEMTNRGIEVGLNLNPISSANFNWVSNINFWKNTSKVNKLPVPAFRAGGFGATLAIFQIEQGQSASQIVGIDPVVQGPDTTIVTRKLGDHEPDFQMSFYNTFNIFKNWEVSFIAQWKKGGDNINLSQLLFDLNGTTGDYDDTDFNTTELRAAVAGIQPGDVNGVKRTKLLGVSAAQYVQDASYFKLREVGVYYNLPRTTLNKWFGDNVSAIRLGVSGNNLITISPYQSYDPEVSNFGTQPVAGGVEVLPYPAQRKFFFNVKIDF